MTEVMLGFGPVIQPPGPRMLMIVDGQPTYSDYPQAFGETITDSYAESVQSVPAQELSGQGVTCTIANATVDTDPWLGEEELGYISRSVHYQVGSVSRSNNA